MINTRTVIRDAKIFVVLNALILLSVVGLLVVTLRQHKKTDITPQKLDKVPARIKIQLNGRPLL